MTTSIRHQHINMPAKVLVAGCGLSGAATSWFLRQMTNSASVRILEAADAVGGRMATHRWSPPEPEPSLDLSLHGQADTGAQYLTQYKEEHSAVFDHLVEKGEKRFELTEFTSITFQCIENGDLRCNSAI